MMRIIAKPIPLIAAFLLSGTLASVAQIFPSKSVRLISPYPAGTGPDLMMRLVDLPCKNACAYSARRDASSPEELREIIAEDLKKS
jgi:tripartite-type tricarboxylate transporter receptor subunit TctC